MTSKMEQKIITLKRGIASALESALNEAAAEGWRLQEVSRMIYRAGGLFYLEPNVLVLERAEGHRQYHCLQVAMLRPKKEDREPNDLIAEQNAAGYRLVRVSPTALISSDASGIREKASGDVIMFFESSSVEA